MDYQMKNNKDNIKLIIGLIIMAIVAKHYFDDLEHKLWMQAEAERLSSYWKKLKPGNKQ